VVSCEASDIKAAGMPDTSCMRGKDSRNALSSRQQEMDNCHGESACGV
jgi:hypothetical protein